MHGVRHTATADWSVGTAGAHASRESSRETQTDAGLPSHSQIAGPSQGAPCGRGTKPRKTGRPYLYSVHKPFPGTDICASPPVAAETDERTGKHIEYELYRNRNVYS